MKCGICLSMLALLVALNLGGCEAGNSSQTKEKNNPKKGEHVHEDGTVHESHEDGHEHASGPHGGVITDWGGGKFHVEFTVDHGKKEATIYILGSDEKSSISIDSEEVFLSIKEPATQIALKPFPQEGDEKGRASRFRGNHVNLEKVMEYEGSISGVVDSIPYSGNFKEVAHDH